MKLVGIIGHFGFGLNMLNGQTIKTKIVTKALEDRFGNNEVFKVDTHGGAKTYLKLPFKMIGLLRCCENIIIFPAHNGVRVIAPMLLLINSLYHRKIHYVVIGGWLSEMCEQNPWLMKQLQKIDYIYVETTTMKNALEKQGFRNVLVMPNFKDLKILDKPERRADGILKLCSFSRVMKEKGIAEAVEATKILNDRGIDCTLTIFGQIDKHQIEWFEKLKMSFPEFVRYGGVIPYDQSVDCLKNYDVLLFPTYYEGEGFAGTLLDAMAAGVPIVASDWKYNREIVNERNGVLVPVKDSEALASAVQCIKDNHNLKETSLEEARKYMPAEAIKPLIERIC